MKRNSRYSRHGGLTLVELLVALLILAVVATLGAPAFSRSLNSYRQRAAVQSLLTACQLARNEAVTGQTAVTLCPVAAGDGACGEDYAGGWQVFVDRDDDQNPDDDEPVLQRFDPLIEALRVSDRAGRIPVSIPITWYPDGSARRNLTLQVCAKNDEVGDSLSVVLNLAGRPRVARGEGICPAGSA